MSRWYAITSHDCYVNRSDPSAKYGPTTTLHATLEPFFSLSATLRSVTNVQRDLILRIIPSISWTAEIKLRASDQWTEWQDTCVELHAVQDADRLDAIGAVGILRVAAYEGAKGKVLIDDGLGHSAESHFEEKLLKIRDRMKVRVSYFRKCLELNGRADSVG